MRVGRLCCSFDCNKSSTNLNPSSQSYVLAVREYKGMRLWDDENLDCFNARWSALLFGRLLVLCFGGAITCSIPRSLSNNIITHGNHSNRREETLRLMKGFLSDYLMKHLSLFIISSSIVAMLMIYVSRAAARGGNTENILLQAKCTVLSSGKALIIMLRCCC
jgi:hypothetical protein